MVIEVARLEVSSLPRIVLVAPYFGPEFYGGAVKVYEGIFGNLSGWDVHVVAETHPEAQAHDDALWASAHIRVHRLPGLIVRHFSGGPLQRQRQALAQVLAARQALRALLARLHAQVVVHGATRDAAWAFGTEPRTARRIAYVHGEELTLPPYGRGVDTWLRQRQRRALRRCDRVIAVSHFTRNLLLDQGVAAERIQVIHNFIDQAKWRPAEDLECLRERLAWTGKLVFLTVARLIPRKGVDDLLRALHALRTLGQLPGNFRQVIVGTGDVLAELQAQCAELGLSNVVQFAGRLDDTALREHLQACDAFVLPNKTIDGDQEGFGIVFLEASACGKPVLGGRSGGVPEAIEDGVSGLLSPPGASYGLLTALHQLVHDDALRQRLGRQGLERVRAGFDVHNKRAELENMLARLCADWDSKAARP